MAEIERSGGEAGAAVPSSTPTCTVPAVSGLRQRRFRGRLPGHPPPAPQEPRHGGPLARDEHVVQDLSQGLAFLAIQQGYQLGIDEINRTGGLAGCRAALAMHDFQFLANDGWDGESQKECTDYTEDQHVLAAFTNEYECLMVAISVV